MISFSGYPFHQDGVLQFVRWYLAYSPSYRDIEDISKERVFEVDGRTELWWGGFDYIRSTNPLAPDTLYQVKEGDTIDRITFAFYQGQVKDYQEYYWVVVGANADKIVNPQDIADIVGEVIVIPNPTGFQAKGGE